MKYLPKPLKPIVFLTTIILLQSCVVYKSKPISIEEASQYNDRQIKITTVDSNEHKLNWIEDKGGNVVSISNTKRIPIKHKELIKIKTVAAQPVIISLDSAYNHRGSVKMMVKNENGIIQSTKCMKIKWDGDHITGIQQNTKKDTATVVIPIDQIDEIRYSDLLMLRQ